jgi:hypothetical protein
MLHPVVMPISAAVTELEPYSSFVSTASAARSAGSPKIGPYRAAAGSLATRARAAVKEGCGGVPGTPCDMSISGPCDGAEE